MNLPLSHVIHPVRSMMPMPRKIRFVPFAMACTLYFGLCMSLMAQESRDRERGFAEGTSVAEGRYLPPGQPLPSQFRLGVQIRNTPTGVVVTRVVPGSVAQQIGLEAGDTILAVSGYQVGVVEGQVYDVGDEVSRRMARQGSATLLVLNHRNGQIVNIPVQSETVQAAAILGTANTNDRRSVAPGMTLDARVLDVTYPQWRDMSIAETQVPITGQWPVGFRLDYDPSLIRPNHRYAVEAQISYRGQIIQRTLDPIPVNLSTPSPRVSLTLVASSQPPINPGPGGGIASTPIDQVEAWYVELLGRGLSDRERAVWQRELSRGKPPQEILSTILGSSEYSDRFRSDSRSYVVSVYQYLYGRSPSPQELARWQSRLVQLRNVRLTLVQEMLRDSMKR